jgi:hypothetical protein
VTLAAAAGELFADGALDGGRCVIAAAGAVFGPGDFEAGGGEAALDGGSSASSSVSSDGDGDGPGGSGLGGRSKSVTFRDPVEDGRAAAPRRRASMPLL